MEMLGVLLGIVIVIVVLALAYIFLLKLTGFPLISILVG